MKTITLDCYAEMRTTVPSESLAHAHGYPVHSVPSVSDPAAAPLQRFPRSFVRMLRQAVVTEAMSPTTATAFVGLALPDIAVLISQQLDGPERQSPSSGTEFREFAVTGVV